MIRVQSFTIASPQTVFKQISVAENRSKTHFRSCVWISQNMEWKEETGDKSLKDAYCEDRSGHDNLATDGPDSNDSAGDSESSPRRPIKQSRLIHCRMSAARDLGPSKQKKRPRSTKAHILTRTASGGWLTCALVDQFIGEFLIKKSITPSWTNTAFPDPMSDFKSRPFSSPPPR